jgi:transposase-like protein
MAKTRRQKHETVEDLLRDIMIVQLALAGVGQLQIRQIVGVDMHRVNRIAKHIRKAKE